MLYQLIKNCFLQKYHLRVSLSLFDLDLDRSLTKKFTEPMRTSKQFIDLLKAKYLQRNYLFKQNPFATKLAQFGNVVVPCGTNNEVADDNMLIQLSCVSYN